jgi:hypothetical protein
VGLFLARPNLGERRPSRLLATAGEERCGVELQMPKSVGWVIYAAGFAIWLFGYLSKGHASLFDWKSATPWWISSFVPNLEAEIGLALSFASAIPTLPWARLLPFAAVLVLAAVTFAWWGFLAWLIWHWMI